VDSPYSIHLNKNKTVYIVNDTHIKVFKEEQKQFVPFEFSSDVVKFNPSDSKYLESYSGDHFQYNNSSYEITTGRNKSGLYEISQQGELTWIFKPSVSVTIDKYVKITNFTSESFVHNVNTLNNVKPDIDDNGYIYFKENDGNIYYKYINSLPKIGTTHPQPVNLVNVDFIIYKIKISNGNVTLAEEDSTQKLFTIHNYFYNNHVDIGHANELGSISNSSNILIGNEIHSNDKSNQIIIGSRNNGIMDDCVQLGNAQTQHIIPSSHKACTIGNENYKFKSIYVDHISFGNDLMKLPSNDGEDNQMLVRKGERQLVWSDGVNGVQKYLDDLIDCHAPQAGNKYNVFLPSANRDFDAKKQNPTGNQNTVMGFKDNNYTNFDSLSGSDNTIMGFNSGNKITSGNNNTILGSQGGNKITSGYNNTILGYQAGNTITTGSNNIIIGAGANVSSGSGKIIIGNGATDTGVEGDNVVVIGNELISKIVPGNNAMCDLGTDGKTFSTLHIEEIEVYKYINCRGPITTISDSRLKKNILDLNSKNCIDFVNDLRPVSFEYIHSQKSQLGFIAQEVADSAKRNNLDETLVEKNAEGMFSLNYQTMIAPLVKTIQSQNATIEYLTKRIEALEAKMNEN
jgi:hypothetical protein